MDVLLLSDTQWESEEARGVLGGSLLASVALRHKHLLAAMSQTRF
jgi:hypothetical protein